MFMTFHQTTLVANNYFHLDFEIRDDSRRIIASMYMYAKLQPSFMRDYNYFTDMYTYFSNDGLHCTQLLMVYYTIMCT